MALVSSSHTAQQISISAGPGVSALGDNSTKIGVLELWLRCSYRATDVRLLQHFSRGKGLPSSLQCLPDAFCFDRQIHAARQPIYYLLERSERKISRSDRMSAPFASDIDLTLTELMRKYPFHRARTSFSSSADSLEATSAYSRNLSQSSLSFRKQCNTYREMSDLPRLRL